MKLTAKTLNKHLDKGKKIRRRCWLANVLNQHFDKILAKARAALNKKEEK
jgi:hypothetical protein